jgi:hypothetical protein
MLGLCLMTFGAGAQETAVPAPYEANWDSLKQYTTPEWYLDAKFGIFIHWGVYSVPAFGSEWHTRNMYKAGSGGCNRGRARNPSFSDMEAQ